LTDISNVQDSPVAENDLGVLCDFNEYFSRKLPYILGSLGLTSSLDAEFDGPGRRNFLDESFKELSQVICRKVNRIVG
tara:strand:+ start:30 stop:263 length:234 start_codon:yes stop_codon:yes gene_type:complete